MMWHVSVLQLGLVIILLGISCILIARRWREAREGVSIIPASRGGSPMWVWVVIAVWTGLSLLLGIVLLLTGHAVIDY
jgi:uncharacterized protein YjeT (DUF2065 family)